MAAFIFPESDEAALQFIEDITTNAKAVQENTLSEIVTQNAHTEYLMAFHLHEGATDEVEAFKSRVPIIGYDDQQPLIRRIADGDTSPILSAQPISQFYTSSATSGGEPKLIPTTEESRNRGSLLYTLAASLLNMQVKELKNGKGLYFQFTRQKKKTKRWHSYNACSYKLVQEPPLQEPTLPWFYQPCRSHLLSGCIPKYLLSDALRLLPTRVGAFFASALLRVIRFLQLNWQLLAHDIHTGTLNPKITDELIRQRMALDPELADFVAHHCANNAWEGIIPRLWPNTMFLDAVITGSMSQYIQSLDYYSGGLPIVSLIYASSEAYFGIKLNPLCDPSQVSYTIMPNVAYFEFLPHQTNSPQLTTHHQLVDLANVEIGAEYEIVVTTHAGLNRYRVGDILRVTGFHNSVPQFQFVCRKNVYLSVDSEKTEESELQAAVEKVSRSLRMVDYTSYADNTAIPGHYVIFCELGVHNSVSDSVLQQCCLEIEESLNSTYRLLRYDESIGALEIRVVKNGTFDDLMEFAMSNGASVAQYKMSRCIRDQQIVRFLNTQVVSANSSPSLPNGYQVYG